MNVAFAGLHIVFSGLGNCVFPELPSGVNYGHRAWPARRAQGTACSHGGRAAWNCGFLHWPLQDHSRSARGKCECPELPPARTTRSPGAACARRTGNCVFPELASRVNYAFTGRGLRAKNRELRVPTAGALQGSAGFQDLLLTGIGLCRPLAGLLTARAVLVHALTQYRHACLSRPLLDDKESFCTHDFTEIYNIYI